MLAALALALALPTYGPIPQPSPTPPPVLKVPTAPNVALIVNSGSTNTAGYQLTVTEDGTPQTIRFCEHQALTANASPANASAK